MDTGSDTTAPHLLDNLARLCRGVVAMLLNPEMRGARDVDFGRGMGYSITSSARARSAGGTVRPSVFAVFTLMLSTNLVG
jgi:hypothetical protein